MESDVQPLGAMNPSQKIGFQECLLPGAPSLRHNLLLHRHGSVPASGIPRGKKKQAALWQQPGTGTETCAHQLLLLAAPWLCHPPRRLLSLCQQCPAAVTSTVRWHSLSPAPPRTFLCPPHSPGCGQSLLSPSAARISSGVDFSLVVPVCPPALWLLRLSRGRRLARECHISALAPSCPLRVCSASSPLFAACLLPGAAQGQRRATELSPAAFALPALSCSEISPSRSAVPSRRAAPASSGVIGVPAAFLPSSSSSPSGDRAGHGSTAPSRIFVSQNWGGKISGFMGSCGAPPSPDPLPASS